MNANKIDVGVEDIVSPDDELVFSIGKEKQEVKQVSNTPLLPLVREDHPGLKQVMPLYDRFETDDAKDRFAVVQAMIHTMRSYGGVGLSAPQIGAELRLFVMDRIDEKHNKRAESLVCFNPEIIRELAPAIPRREACLSFPGLSLQIKRAAEIEVRFQDENGQLFELELSGIDARVFQHELDHMNGVLFTSKTSLLDWEREKQRKVLKKAKQRFKASRRAIAKGLKTS